LQCQKGDLRQKITRGGGAARDLKGEKGDRKKSALNPGATEEVDLLGFPTSIACRRKHLIIRGGFREKGTDREKDMDSLGAGLQYTPLNKSLGGRPSEKNNQKILLEAKESTEDVRERVLSGQLVKGLNLPSQGEGGSTSEKKRTWV